MPLAAATAAFLSGCWTPPSAGVRPHGAPRVVEQGIEVERVADAANVVWLDRAARTISLSVRGARMPACKIGRSVRNWEGIHVGDQVHATIDEILTVYVAAGNRSPDARVLAADPGYRLLTVQYQDGHTETFKVGLHTRMKEIEAGDSVAIRPMEALEIRVQRSGSPERTSRRRAAAAR